MIFFRLFKFFSLLTVDNVVKCLLIALSTINWVKIEDETFKNFRIFFLIFKFVDLLMR